MSTATLERFSVLRHELGKRRVSESSHSGNPARAGSIIHVPIGSDWNYAYTCKGDVLWEATPVASRDEISVCMIDCALSY